MTTHLLLLDDDRDLLDIFQAILEEEGYDLTLSVLPIMQVSEIERINPDLILFDLRFPPPDSGQDMMKMLKNHLSTHRIPLVVCTADLLAARQLQEYVTSEGIQVVNKPFDLRTLLDTIDQALPISKRLRRTSW
ncbi:MAG TPA: response regulator [Ktedonobacteraceae bacterium]|nr:response regulator [Ktedonobacteraceae bacterium]